MFDTFDVVKLSRLLPIAAANQPLMSHDFSSQMATPVSTTIFLFLVLYL